VGGRGNVGPEVVSTAWSSFMYTGISLRIHGKKSLRGWRYQIETLLCFMYVGSSSACIRRKVGQSSRRS
jgi:hypothetical protein